MSDEEGAVVHRSGAAGHTIAIVVFFGLSLIIRTRARTYVRRVVPCLRTLIARAILLHVFVVRVFLVPHAHAHTVGGSLLVGIGVGAAVGWSGTTRRRNLRFCFM